MSALLIAATPVARCQTAHLSGRGGDADRASSPVVLPIKADLPAGPYVLEGGPVDAHVPAVVFEDEDRRWLAAVLPAIPAGKPFDYAVKRHHGPVAPAGIEIRPHESELHVKLDGHQPFVAYQPMSNSKPILYPVIGPTGEPFTRSYPMEDVKGEDRDHPHQRSFWFTHGSVNGVDFWAEDKPGTPPEKRTKGSIRETERRVVVREGPVLARFRTRNEWLAPNGRPVCQDRRTFTFFRTPAGRIIDFEITIEATAGPVTFGDTKEGMFGLRLASTMDVKRKKGGKITNAEGLTDGQAWGKASPWVDYVGPVKDETVGVAILNHPGSFRFPTTWHVRDYGLFAANPFGWKDFGRTERGDYTLPAGQSLRFAYRVILHRGDTASLGAPALFQAYAHPPEVSVRAD